jgi:hypothetical protein
MKNTGYRLTLACHNRRGRRGWRQRRQHRPRPRPRLPRHPPSDHPQLRGPRLHLEPRPYDRPYDGKYFLTKIFFGFK